MVWRLGCHRVRANLQNLKQSIVRKGEHKAKVHAEEEELKAMLVRLEARQPR